MTDPTPTTEAGRRLHRHLPEFLKDILAIEAEARAEALREAAERVRALYDGKGVGWVETSAVLAILAGETE